MEQAQITHHDINNDVLLKINEKRINRLERKQQPKTLVERQRPFYLLLLATAVICEIVDCTLTFSGIIHFATTYLNDNGFLISAIIGSCVIILSLFKHKTMDVYHAQRLDDEHIPNSTYLFIFIFFVVSAGATYNVTPAALQYLTKSSALHSLDSVSVKFDSLLASDLVVISKEIATADTAASNFYTSRVYKGKLRSNDSDSYSSALASVTAAQGKITAVTLARNNEKELALSTVQKKNDAIIQAHKDWCIEFGFWLAVGLFLVEMLYFPAKWFCENYERAEVTEAKEKKARIEKQAQAQTDLLAQGQRLQKEAKEIEERAKVEVKEKVKDTINKEPTTITFGNHAPKEGDIEKGEGRKRDRVMVEVAGELRAYTLGQINTLIAGQTTTQRITHLENLKNKLL